MSRRNFRQSRAFTRGTDSNDPERWKQKCKRAINHYCSLEYLEDSDRRLVIDLFFKCPTAREQFGEGYFSAAKFVEKWGDFKLVTRPTSYVQFLTVDDVEDLGLKMEDSWLWATFLKDGTYKDSCFERISKVKFADRADLAQGYFSKFGVTFL